MKALDRHIFRCFPFVRKAATSRKACAIALLLLFAFAGRGYAQDSLSTAANERIAFRGAWIATVANIDWPSTEAVGNTDRQQMEMLFLLDSLYSIGINTIIFQVRPTSDALYLSELEPISHWLTGSQGKWGQQQEWDPLEFVVEQAHQRGMAVHVWLNPYRVNLAKSPTTAMWQNHIFKSNPEWFWQYNGQWYFNPGLDETRDWICMVVEDIVSRYDIQGIHMDDYFYPYPVAKQAIPDAQTFKNNPRGFTNIADWRRDNVNLTIQLIHQAIRSLKPEVEFGISPFGVWRNMSKDSVNGSATRAGITNYDDLYADVLLWMREGWIDYVLPQLYWEIGKPAADYEVLAHWWAEHAAGCKLYIGMAPYRLEGKKETAAWRTGNEISRQMRLNRTIPEITGECFYSTRPLLRNPRHVCDSIRSFYLPYLPDLPTNTIAPVR